MRVIIAGTRTLSDAKIVEQAVQASGFQLSEVISGGARGVDQMGEEWAVRNNIPFRRFVPDWKLYKRGAGPQRNRLMASEADALIAIWDGKSKGAADMLRIAKKFNLKTLIYTLPESSKGDGTR